MLIHPITSPSGLPWGAPLRRWDAFTKLNLFPIKKKKKAFVQSDERTPEGSKTATAFNGGNDVWKVG